MNTCATCKHWEAPRSNPDPATWRGWKPDHGDCHALVHESDEREYIAHIEREITGFGFGVRTRADFGCTLWQARDGVLGNMMTDGRSSWPKESK